MSLIIEEHQENAATQILINSNNSSTRLQSVFLVTIMFVWFLAMLLMAVKLGAWPVIIFVLITIFGVTASFQYWSKRSSDFEKLIIQSNELIWESYQNGQMDKKVFNPGWLKVQAYYAANGDCEKLALRAHGKSYLVANQTTYEERDRLYQLLKSKLGFGFA